MKTFVFDLEGSTDEEVGLKAFIGERTYIDLTDGGQDDIGDQALHEAEVRIDAKYKCTKATAEEMIPDWTDQTVILAGLYYATYYLYAQAENEKVAEDKRWTGNQVLSSIIGICAFDIDQEDGIPPKDFVDLKERETPPTIVVSAPDLSDGYYGGGGCDGIY